MNTISETINNTAGYNFFNFQNQQPINAVTKAAAENRISTSSLSVETRIQAAADMGAVNSASNFEKSTQEINNATALVQSIDSSAAEIEGKLNQMKAKALAESGCGCMRKLQESIRDIANSYSWNGVNYMVGGGEGNQNTTTMKISVEVEAAPKKSVDIELKSFDPMSAVDTKGELDPSTPNLPDLNKSAGTDSHVYGDAAMYSGLSEDKFLHTHTKELKEQTLLQLARAMDGISSERSRLKAYLRELDLYAESSQKENLRKIVASNQIRSSERAIDVAETSISEFLRGQASNILSLFDQSEPKLQVLLN